MNQPEFRLDRTKFRMQSFREADIEIEYWSEKSYLERLEAAYYLISTAYCFGNEDFPRMDRTKFSTRSHRK